MTVHQADLPGCLMIELRLFGDEHGCFYEGWNRRPFVADGINVASQ